MRAFLLVLLAALAGCVGDVPIPETPDVDDEAQSLMFRLPVDLGSFDYLVAAGTSCQDATQDRDGDCGLSEAQVEVDGLGTIYVSGVCCIGNAPPVYVSRDGGATFQLLETDDGVREKFGVEGDFAIDDLGRVYFADIEFAVTFQITVWDADGTYLRHMKWPAPPLVDRDWIRAEGDGVLYYVYNTGSATNVYKSADGGATWSPTPMHEAAFGLGTATLGGEGELWLLGGSAEEKVQAEYTIDGGATWRSETTTLPSGGANEPGAFDEAGNLYATSSADGAIHVARRSTEGWLPPVTVSGPGQHRFPWIAAGGAGDVAVCWYGTSADDGNGDWLLHVAVSTDADSAAPTFTTFTADPLPVFQGNLGRDLLDFIQCEIGPDGAVHVAYSKLESGRADAEEQMHYVRSEPFEPLKAQRYPNGPYA